MLKNRPADIEATCRAIASQRKRRTQDVDQRNKAKLRSSPLTTEHLVLAYDYVRHIDMSNDRKLQYRWMGPYRIVEALPHNRFKLQDVTGVPIRGVFHGDRLKAFRKDPDGTWEPLDTDKDRWSQEDPQAPRPSPNQDKPPPKRRGRPPKKPPQEISIDEATSSGLPPT